MSRLKRLAIDDQGNSGNNGGTPAPSAPINNAPVSPATPFTTPLPQALVTPPPTQQKAINVDDAREALRNIMDRADKIADDYLSFFETMTSLSSDYPQLYNTLKMTVRFPNNEQASQVDHMRDNINEMVNMYLSDDTYLGEAIGVHPGGNAESSPANKATPSLKTDSPPSSEDALAPKMTPTKNLDGTEVKNDGDDEGLPPSSDPGSKFTPGMSPSSKQPFSDVYHNSGRLTKRLLVSSGGMDL